MNNKNIYDFIGFPTEQEIVSPYIDYYLEDKSKYPKLNTCLINDKDYYWIKVGEGEKGTTEKDFKTEFNFFIYPKNFDIKYYAEKENKLMSIEEWRKKK